MITDPSHPDYNATARDAIMDLCPFYDPHHKCGIVREKVFKECLTELRERNRVTLATLAEMKRQQDEASNLAAELVAIIRVNAKRATWSAASADDVDEFLKPWIAKLRVVQGHSPANGHSAGTAGDGTKGS